MIYLDIEGTNLPTVEPSSNSSRHLLPNSPLPEEIGCTGRGFDHFTAAGTSLRRSQTTRGAYSGLPQPLFPHGRADTRASWYAGAAQIEPGGAAAQEPDLRPTCGRSLHLCGVSFHEGRRARVTPRMSSRRFRRGGAAPRRDRRRRAGEEPFDQPWVDLRLGVDGLVPVGPHMVCTQPASTRLGKRNPPLPHTLPQTGGCEAMMSSRSKSM